MNEESGTMLEGKNIIVTGCQAEIGRQAMKVFAENGANVFACSDSRTGEFEDECAALGEEHRVRIVPVCFRMSDRDGPETAARAILADDTDIHGLACIPELYRRAPLAEMTAEDLEETIQVDCIAPLLFIRHIAGHMKKKNTAGSIAVVSSIAALDGGAGETAYAAAMGALIGAMRSMAAELGGQKIRVNAVAPGTVINMAWCNSSAEALDRRIRMTALRRAGMPAEIANVLMFLMSDMSPHITGQTIRVDGGMR